MSVPGTLDPPRSAPEAGRGAAAPPVARRRRLTWRRALRRDWQLYSLAVLPLLFLLVFRYLPMIGNVIAFRQFRPGGSLFGEYWVGLRYVRLFLDDPTFWNVVHQHPGPRRADAAGLLPAADRAGAAVQRAAHPRLKRFAQSVSYLPHFMSIVIIAAMVMQLLCVDGTVNQAVGFFGGEPIPFLQQPEWFRTIYVSLGGLADRRLGHDPLPRRDDHNRPDLYEAARIDGASRWRQTWHVTLPGIRPTMVTLLILNIGTFMAVGFEKILLLYNPLMYPTADVISTYLYRVGISRATSATPRRSACSRQ